MESLFLKILNMSITASYVILVVLAIRLFLARAPKKFSYMLWSVVGFRLICPASLSSVISILNILNLSRAQTSDAAINYIPGDIGYMANPMVTTGLPPMINSVINDSLPVSTSVTGVNPLQMWITLGSIFWCIGFAALLIYAVVTYSKVKGRMATAIPLEGNVYESDQTRSPFILGFFRPKVYIPFGLSEGEKDYILRHEACHLGRGDHLIKPLAFCLLAVHWFNPLVWLAFALMNRDMEMSCDEAVLSATGAGIVRDYSLSLLSLATNRPASYASPLAFGESSVKKRVANILRFKRPRLWMTIIAALLCVIVIVACGVNPLKKDNPPPSISSLYGRYRFSRIIYLNPLSPFVPAQDYMAIYVLSEEGLVVDLDSVETKVTGVWEAAAVNAKDFKAAFAAEANIPRISGYKARYQYTLTGDFDQVYRLYYLDGRIWLARLHGGKLRNIYEIIKATQPAVPGEHSQMLDLNTVVKHYLYDLFDSGGKMVFTLEVKGHAPRVCETTNRWYAERYGVLLDHYHWRNAQAGDIPQSSDYTLTIYSADKSKYFRFFSGSNAVIYSDDGTDHYMLATARQEGHWDIAATIRIEYDGMEAPYHSIFVETSSHDFLEVANLFMQEYGRQQLARSPGSSSAITDFRVIENEVYLTKEGDDSKFCFMTTFAVRPVNYDNSPWWAGGTEAGSGELAGYIKVFRQIRLERDGDIWRCTSMGTGGVMLD